MPFKTRKQKEVAASRRFLQSTLSISYDGNSKALEHHESSIATKNKHSFSTNKQSFSTNKNLSFAQNLDSRDARIKQSFSTNKQSFSTNKQSFSTNKDTFTIEKLDYVGRDIIKILLLASIISGAQIVLALLRAPLKVW